MESAWLREEEEAMQPAWPYDSEAATRLLDPQLIRRQGLFFLCRALNIRRLVAFLGSGTSMAYGRVSWAELGDSQVSGIIEVADRTTDLAQPISQLVSQLRQLKVSVKEEKSESITLAMQLAEQIWTLSDERLERALIERFQLKGVPLAGYLESDHDRKRELFRWSLKSETYDERHHVRRIFTNPFERGDSVNDFATRNLVHRTLQRFPRESRFPVHALFSDAVLKEMQDEVGRRKKEAADAGGVEEIAKLIDFADEIIGLLRREYERSSTRTLSPVSYYAVGLAIDSLRAAGLVGGASPLLISLRDALEKASARSPTPARRDSIIPRKNDPLWFLATALRIKRFVTTNYDLEIERLIDDLGFDRTNYESQQHLNDDEVERIGPMGGRARDIVLKETNAADLLDFAAGDGPYNIQAVHVHGRATDHDEVVVTDRDYQNKYIGDDRNKVVMREGLQVLFGGNPILFVGLGLSEGDVMRPLREFAGEHIRRNPSVIALKPATDKTADRDTFVMEQYIRHGVYVLHFGFISSGPRRGTSWIEDYFGYSKAIVTALEHLAAKDKYKDLQATDDLLASIETKRKALLGTFEASDAEIVDKLRSFRSDHADCCIAFEFEVLDSIRRYLRGPGRLLRDKWPADYANTFFATVLRNAVNRTKDAVRTAALASWLQGLERRWVIWQKEWAKLPPTRLQNLQFLTQRDLILGRRLGPLGVTRWVRHLVSEAQPSVAPAARIEALLGGWPLLSVDCANPGRRIFLIAGPRGAGKGSLHGELTTYGDCLLHGAVPGSAPPEPVARYAAMFSASFSFSSEIASVWDAFAAFLLNPAAPACDTARSAEWERSGPGRISRLQFGLRNVASQLKSCAAFASASDPPLRAVERCLVIFQAFDLLFDQDGYPKNSEIRAICDALFSSNTDKVPVDYVLIVRESRIPLYFRGKSWAALSSDRREKCRPHVMRLLGASPGPSGKTDDSTRLLAAIARTGVQINVDDAATPPWLKSLLGEHNRGGGNSRDYLHFLPPLTSGIPGFLNEQPPDNGSRTDEIEPALRPLLKNRFQLTLHRLVETDRTATAGPDPFSSLGAGNSQGQFSTDYFFERILDYWAMRPTDVKTSRGVFAPIFDGCSLNAESRQRITEWAHDFKLQELLLRHLAVISTPVEADVLGECPGIKGRILKLVTSDESDDIRTNRNILLCCALELLVSRGLAFAIYRRQVTEAASPKTTRYQVHRAIQLYVYRKLGAQNPEPADAYFFSVSLFASQTRELPILNANAYGFLLELMSALIGYPRPDDGQTPKRPDGQQARCLRAGIGIARTLFSIGVVARFDDLVGINIPIPPRPGYFERHRLALRWMLREADRLGKPRPAGSEAIDFETNDWLPFYPDEIVWLFNECGVFSLAQGQSFDAVAMLEAALAMARMIEGPDGGSVRRRVLLNLGVCAINRGRPNEALRLLQEVQREAGEDETVLLIAEGYMASLHHIGGARDAAFDGYKKAIDGLIALGRSRPVSLFLRYRGELHRDMRNFGRANEDLSAAIDYARRGGSEDMAWFAMVAKARMEITHTKEIRQVSKTLENAERYADAMDLPMLKAEVSFVHAHILLRQGETALAGEKATQALRIAALHGLVVRSIAYRSLLADIHRERGWSDEADRMKAQALQAARSAGYRLLLQRHATGVGPDAEIIFMTHGQAADASGKH